jgi:hypothetical protein
MKKIMNVSDTIPTGPIVFESKDFTLAKSIVVMRLGGSNSFGLRAPDDEKSWVGLYYYLEKLIKEMFYFSFLMKGTEADTDVVGRFIYQSRDEKCMVGKTFDGTVKERLIEHPNDGLLVRGGTVLVTGKETIAPNLVFASSKHLDAGIHRVICRLYCTKIAQEHPNLTRPLIHRFDSSRLGSIGIVTSSYLGGEEPTVKLAKSQDLFKSGKTDEAVFGMTIEYDEDICKLSVLSSTVESNHYSVNDFTVKSNPGDLHYIAVELAATVLNEAHSLLSVRYCDEDEWEKFLNHTNPSSPGFHMVGELEAHINGVVQIDLNWNE